MRVLSHIAILVVLLLLTARHEAVSQLFVERITVFAVDTLPKQTQFLPAGKRFDFLCSGTFSFWRNLQGDSVGLADAAFYRDIPPGEFGFPGLSTSVTNGFLLNGMPISARIDPPGVSPTYNYRVPFTGLGAPATLFIADHPPLSIDRHADNTGAIQVEIYNVSPEIDLVNTVIDFGEVELGDRRDTVIQFRNIGYGPLRVDGFRLFGSDPTHFAVNAAQQYVLAPGDSASFVISFEPTTVLAKSAQLEFLSNDSDVPTLNFELRGVGVTTLAAGVADTVYGRAQEPLLLPILLTRNRAGSNTTTFTLDLDYDPHLLYPIGWSNAGTLTNGHALDVDLSQPGTIRIRGNGGPALDGTGVLLHLRCIPLWHEPNIAPLQVRTLTFNAGNPRALPEHGVLVVDSMCLQHRKTLTYTGVPTLRQNHPNPFNPSTTISFDLPVAQHVRVDVYSQDGRLVRTLVDGVLREGRHDYAFLASGLPSGTYVCMVHTSAGSAANAMVLLR